MVVATLSTGAFLLRFGFLFFFQAEDGIRDGTVTGVQTCALPILLLAAVNLEWTVCRAVRHLYLSSPRAELSNSELQTRIKGCSGLKKYKKLWERSEERRVGKECRSRRGPG